MPQQVIGMLTPTGDVKITPISGSLTSYKTIFDSFNIDQVTELIAADVFANEGTTVTTPGRDMLRCTASGLITEGSTISGTLIPFPQGATILFQYATGCSISAAWNSTRSGANRQVNTNGRLSLDLQSTSAYVVLWATT